MAWADVAAWAYWGALNAGLTLLVLAAGLAVNVLLWKTNHKLARIAEAQERAARPVLRIRNLELGSGDVIVDLVNEGGRDGAIRDVYTSRIGVDGKEERYFLDLREVLPNNSGHRLPPQDYLVRSGDRRRFFCPAPEKVHRLIGDKWIPAPRRKHVEPWFGDDSGPATLHVLPVTGEGDAAPMPVRFVDGSPARDS